MDTPNSSLPQEVKAPQDKRILAAISYLGILCVVVHLIEKNDAFVRFHARQGIVLLVLWVALWVGMLVPVLGQIVWLVGSICVGILMLVGFIKALTGEWYTLPVVGKYAEEYLKNI
ncbi:hypothetical protein HYV73_00470 [Candidatus Uhrbacteria bacterium]|nr:hypothetical protein [Candidatus Uhrbacteria bacterium]